MVVVVDDGSKPEVEVKTGKIAGFDFGLRTFLTGSDGSKIESPQFFKQSLNAIRKASKQHSKKLKSSSNRERARKNLVRKHEDISNRRRDWFWKLAHELTDKFDVLCFETLNLKGMQRLWGRKISDLARSEFISILEWVAKKKNKLVVFIDKDLLAHSQAEEEIVYPRVRSFYGNDDTQELYDEQAQMKQMLDEIKAIDPASADEFRSKIKQLMDVVGDHIRQEESTMLAAIDKNCSKEQKEQMASDFKAAKSKIQQEMVASI
ncbi:MAG: transposase [Hydrococcus sp. Prado102]|jgi:hemerythrin superfamily protein|nr:transposase [Hydrococcus sp. Prado102]